MSRYAAGFNKEQAKGQVSMQSEIMVDLLESKLATKEDIHKLEGNIHKLESGIQSLEKDIGRLEKSTEERFTHLERSTEERFTHLERSTEERFTHLEQNLSDRIDKYYYKTVFALGGIVTAGVSVLAALKLV